MAKKNKKQKTDVINDAWTTRELRAYIRQETQSMNYRLLEYYESETNPNPVVARLKEKLVKLGTGKETRTGFIGLGLTYKTKAELIQQARALQQAAKIDLYTPAGKKAYKEKELKQYESFKAARPGINITEDEYHDLVESLGALGSHVLEEFGYEELINIYVSANSKKKIDIVKEVVELKRQTEGAGLDNTKLIDLLRDKMVELKKGNRLQNGKVHGAAKKVRFRKK